MMMSGKNFLKSQPRFELAAKGVFRLERCYCTSSGRAFQVFGPAAGKSTAKEGHKQNGTR